MQHATSWHVTIRTLDNKGNSYLRLLDSGRVFAGEPSLGNARCCGTFAESTIWAMLSSCRWTVQAYLGLDFQETFNRQHGNLGGINTAASRFPGFRWRRGPARFYSVYMRDAGREGLILHICASEFPLKLE